ncbi:MAG TPA: cell division protein ZapA [Fibrobacteria bacterium]|nr:cell division protein ZapA [Fibrobacteria bacterium]
MADRPLDNTRRVAIGGESFNVRSDAAPETIDQVARLVDDRLQRARVALGETDRFRAAVLASLQVAGDLVETRQELESAKGELRELREKIGVLARRLSEE